MNIQTRLKKLEMVTSNDAFCAESCRRHPEVIITHKRDGVDIEEPSWYGKLNGVKKPKRPILEVCDVCRKPTRKQPIAINWVTNIKEN